MATAYLIGAPYNQFLDNNGTPLAGGLVHTYVAGTVNTPQITYTDSTGTIAAANPIVLDAGGRCAIWANASLKITVADSNDVPVRTTDNITPTNILPPNSVTNAALAQAPAFTIKGNATGATANVTDLTAMQVQQLLGKIPTNISGYISTAQTFTNSTSATMTISAGIASDSTNTVLLFGGSFAWSIANGNAINGYQSGTTLPNSSTIHFYVIAKADLSIYASFASTSLTPTLPSTYFYYRRIFSLNTNSSGSLISGNATEIEGGALLYYLTTQLLDINTTTGTSAARTLYTLTVPTGIKVRIIYRATALTATYTLLTSGDETDVAVAASLTAVPLVDMQDTVAQDGSLLGRNFLTTNTNGQIGARSSSGSANTLNFVTSGFIDFRRV